MFSKAWLGPQSAGPKMSACGTELGSAAERTVTKTSTSAGSFAELARIFARPQSAKLFCVPASELLSWDIVRGGFVSIGPQAIS